MLLKVVEDERAGKYQGEDVQIIPHLTAAIQKYITDAGKGFDVHIVEIGGTVGDIESLSFLEAIREMSLKLGSENCLFIQVVYLPYLGTSGEFKTKPAQNAVRELLRLGIAPDILMARSESKPPARAVIPKLSLFSGVEQRAIVLLPNAPTIYQVPLTLEEAKIADFITERLSLRNHKPDMNAWRRIVKSALTRYRKTVKIGVIAKYTDNQDTYFCVFEALRTAAWGSEVNVDIVWINAEILPKDKKEQAKLRELDAIVVPGGFGPRGIEGKVLAATYALDNKVPYLGLCLGLQVALIAAARRAGLKGANSTEFDSKTPEPVVSTMAEQIGKENTGGTMRLGDYTCRWNGAVWPEKPMAKRRLSSATATATKPIINTATSYGMGHKASGLSPDGHLVEMVEAIDHPYFVSTQAHPEFRSRPSRPHPLFTGLLRAVLNK